MFILNCNGQTMVGRARDQQIMKLKKEEQYVPLYTIVEVLKGAVDYVGYTIFILTSNMSTFHLMKWFVNGEEL